MAASSGSTFMNYGEGLQTVLVEFNAVGQNYAGWRNISFVLCLYGEKQYKYASDDFLVCTPADVMKDSTETMMERDTRPF